MLAHAEKTADSARVFLRMIATCLLFAEVVAVGSRSLAKAEALIACNTEFLSDTVKAYGSYDEALAHEGADAVYMPLPSAIHLEWVRKAAARGLHIMLEKPICVSAVDLEEIMKAVELSGVQLMDGTMW
jgi:predicted dehydrogenase